MTKEEYKICKRFRQVTQDNIFHKDLITSIDPYTGEFLESPFWDFDDLFNDYTLYQECWVMLDTRYYKEKVIFVMNKKGYFKKEFITSEGDEVFKIFDEIKNSHYFKLNNKYFEYLSQYKRERHYLKMEILMLFFTFVTCIQPIFSFLISIIEHTCKWFK